MVGDGAVQRLNVQVLRLLICRWQRDQLRCHTFSTNNSTRNSHSHSNSNTIPTSSQIYHRNTHRKHRKYAGTSNSKGIIGSNNKRMDKVRPHTRSSATLSNTPHSTM